MLYIDSAVLPNTSEVLDETLVQFNSATDRIVIWVFFVTEWMIVCNRTALIDTFEKCLNTPFVWTVLHGEDIFIGRNEVFGIKVDITFDTSSKIGQSFGDIIT